MANLNGKGPNEKGPKTGRGAGNCTPKPKPVQKQTKNIKKK